jgi:D-glycero-D-manno-heptose 1,7-bisphosphate phosphatase
MNAHKAIFLDRDNTIIKDDGYFHDPNAIVFMPGAIEGLRELHRAGFLLFIITNQSGIGRGYFPESETITVHERLIALLKEQQAPIEKIYYCPHAPEDDCPCRKPKPLLILEAAHEFNLDLAKSFFIGDHMKDMGAGRAAGTTTVMVGPPSKSGGESPLIDLSASDIREAAIKIISYETLHLTIQE